MNTSIPNHLDFGIHCVGGLPSKANQLAGTDFFAVADQVATGRTAGAKLFLSCAQTDTLRDGLEQALVCRVAFDCLIEPLIGDVRLLRLDTEPLPTSLLTTICESGLKSVSSDVLVQLVSSPGWLVDLWDALAVPTPYWLKVVERNASVLDDLEADVAEAMAHLDSSSQGDSPVLREEAAGVVNPCVGRSAKSIMAEEGRMKDRGAVDQSARRNSGSLQKPVALSGGETISADQPLLIVGGKVDGAVDGRTDEQSTALPRRLPEDNQ